MALPVKPPKGTARQRRLPARCARRRRPGRWRLCARNRFPRRRARIKRVEEGLAAQQKYSEKVAEVRALAAAGSRGPRGLTAGIRGRRHRTGARRGKRRPRRCWPPCPSTTRRACPPTSWPTLPRRRTRRRSSRPRRRRSRRVGQGRAKGRSPHSRHSSWVARFCGAGPTPSPAKGAAGTCRARTRWESPLRRRS